MSHWTSGLPKLDIPPFDPTPLYQAVAETTRERAEVEARRRSVRRPVLIGVGIAVLVAIVMAALALFA